jgi:hypothetical protein
LYGFSGDEASASQGPSLPFREGQKGNWSEAVLAIKYRRLRVLPPVAKQRQYPPLTLTVIYTQEQTVPTGRDRIDWKLITNLPVSSRREALEKLTWYAMRWKIETFHKILKSGFRYFAF